jgi:hypothetical protein
MTVLRTLVGIALEIDAAAADFRFRRRVAAGRFGLSPRPRLFGALRTDAEIEADR